MGCLSKLALCLREQAVFPPEKKPVHDNIFNDHIKRFVYLIFIPLFLDGNQSSLRQIFTGCRSNETASASSSSSSSLPTILAHKQNEQSAMKSQPKQPILKKYFASKKKLAWFAEDNCSSGQPRLSWLES